MGIDEKVDILKRRNKNYEMEYDFYTNILRIYTPIKVSDLQKIRKFSKRYLLPIKTIIIGEKGIELYK